ncbi:MAG TPA: retropepsin-like aspartic protease [Gemmatimonadaceae bacterium]|nr:retropepsin-like aspartic protease [Gemmatimonadaceae bacterium]
MRPSTGCVLLAIVASAGAVGCGPAKPVLIFTPPSVAIDTSHAGSRATVIPRSTTFWEAMSSLDTGFVNRKPASEAERAFAHALGLVMSGQVEQAALALDSVGTTFPGDTLIHAASRLLMTAMLQYQGKWKLLAELTPLELREAPPPLDLDKADVESWASAFKTVEERQVSFPNAPVVLPLALSASGTPMIPVKINGQERLLWIDTGSSMSIVASDVAADCGVAALVKDTLEVATTTGRVPARPAAIARLQLGGIEFRNSTAMIVASDLMHIRLGDGTDPKEFVKIDGVIGFDIISRLDIRIDYLNHRVTLQKPRAGKPPRGGRNLFWVGAPIVRLVSSKGVPLHFNLDTGAQETYSTEGLVTKTKARTFVGERRLIGGFAGLTVVHGRFVDEVRLTTAGQSLLFRKLLVFAPAFSTLFSIDGVLGSDIGRGGVVRIDATNGLFLLETQRGVAGLRFES